MDRGAESRVNREMEWANVLIAKQVSLNQKRMQHSFLDAKGGGIQNIFGEIAMVEDREARRP